MTTIAFIDAQNLKRAAETIDKKIDYRRFRLWLERKLGVERALMFFGFLPSQQRHYDHLAEAGFELIFRDVEEQYGRVKANVDICLAIHAMDMLDETQKAYLVSSDGDFFDLVERWKRDNKFGGIFSPGAHNKCSRLLKRSSGGSIIFLPNVIHKFEDRT